MRALPNMTIAVPGDQWEAREATKALAATPGTCYLRLDKSPAPATARAKEVFYIGKARTIREGTDITLIATGGILGPCLEAAEALVEQGITCRVLSMHTIKPFDREAVLRACAETGGIVTASAPDAPTRPAPPASDRDSNPPFAPTSPPDRPARPPDDPGPATPLSPPASSGGFSRISSRPETIILRNTSPRRCTPFSILVASISATVDFPDAITPVIR
jgi:hypothetical protein